jgi:ADP-ribosylglycohydrolase
MPDSAQAARFARAWASLTGLSVGDAFGSQHFLHGARAGDLALGAEPDPPWPWTDDTEMACSIVAALAIHGTIDRDALALDFAERCEPFRGYGPDGVALLQSIRNGTPWGVAAAALGHGTGSAGNASAMRVAPLGAYFADDPARVVTEAVRSAEVTHRHPEGVAGAVAVAVAAAHTAAAAAPAGSASTGAGAAGPVAAGADLLDAVAEAVPPGEVRAGLDRARRLGLDLGVAAAAYELGNGSRVLCQDTVPFAIWAAARFVDNYPAAIRACVTAGGDVDTTAAIVGGIVAAGGAERVPERWIASREPLPAWLTAVLSEPAR